MTTGAKVGLSALAGVVLLIVFIVASFFSYSNGAVDYETRIETAVATNKGALGQYRLGVTEMVGTLGLGADLNTDGAVKQIESRYGAGGSQAMMQWLQENNIAAVPQGTLDSIMRKIAAGRADFQGAQERLLDVCRGYKKLQRQPYSGFWLRLAGYPSSEYSEEGGNGKLCRAITSKGAEKAFETGVEDALDIRSGKPEA